METCTWAPTTFQGTAILGGATQNRPAPTGAQLNETVTRYVQHVEALGIDNLLIAQRWWGDARATEGSSLDCLAMTSFIAAQTRSIKLISAIHPGFFQPTAIAKWGATIDHLTGGRWAINVTSGWNMEEFHMYGIDPLSHGQRYQRSAEFIEVLRGAWSTPSFSYQGHYYAADNLTLEPRPTAELTVFQGGQSDAAISMACLHSDWMFVNGGNTDKLKQITGRIDEVAARIGRRPRLAVYAIPLCRDTDAAAHAEIEQMIAAIDPVILAERQQKVSGASGMWRDADKLSMLDTNEGYATGLVGSPDTIKNRIAELRELGIDMLHLKLGDSLFETEVLPGLTH